MIEPLDTHAITSTGENPASQIEHERPIRPTETICEAVIAAVTAIEGVDVDEVEPLYSVVDAEAIGQIVSAASDTRVVFTYAGHRIAVGGRSNSVVVAKP